MTANLERESNYHRHLSQKLWWLSLRKAVWYTLDSGDLAEGGRLARSGIVELAYEHENAALPRPSWRFLVLRLSTSPCNTIKSVRPSSPTSTSILYRTDWTMTPLYHGVKHIFQLAPTVACMRGL